MVGWKMIGFPGARYDYRDWIHRHNVQRFSLGGAAHRPVHESSKAGSAPVSEKRVGLSRSSCRQGYGR
jgi:hypothetical protein